MWKTRREFLACISRSPSLRTAPVWQFVSPALCLRRPPFFLRRKKGGKERRQNQGFEILSAAEVPSASVLPIPRIGMCKFEPCFRIVSASPSATRSALVLPWRDGRRPLRLPCGAMWAAAPTEHLTVDVRKGRPPGRPESGLHHCSCKPVIASRWASWSQ